MYFFVCVHKEGLVCRKGLRPIEAESNNISHLYLFNINEILVQSSNIFCQKSFKISISIGPTF